MDALAELKRQLNERGWPVQASVYVASSANVPMDSLPFSGLSPRQAPLAAQLSASVLDQANMESFINFKSKSVGYIYNCAILDFSFQAIYSNNQSVTYIGTGVASFTSRKSANLNVLVKQITRENRNGYH